MLADLDGVELLLCNAITSSGRKTDVLDAAWLAPLCEIGLLTGSFVPPPEIARLRGVGKRMAEVMIAEMGADMGRFPTPGQLASWAGLCPANNESADKRRAGKARKGNAPCAPRSAGPPESHHVRRAPTCRRSCGICGDGSASAVRTRRSSPSRTRCW